MSFVTNSVVSCCCNTVPVMFHTVSALFFGLIYKQVNKVQIMAQGKQVKKVLFIIVVYDCMSMTLLFLS